MILVHYLIILLGGNNLDYVTPFIQWLIKSDYIKNNKLFLNAAEATDSNIQIVSQQISRNEDKHYVDGSVLHKVKFTVFDFKSISFNQLLKTMLDRNENISDLLEVGNINEYVKSQDEAGVYPDFGKGFEVQSIYCEYSTPSTPTIDNSLAKYSIPIVCEVLELGK